MMDIQSLLLLAKSQYESETIIKETKCCKNPQFIDGEGNVICENCGVVTNIQLNKFSYDEECTVQTGVNANIYGNILGTKIYGNSMLSRMNNWNSFAYQDRVILDVANNLETMISDKVSKQVIDSAVLKYQTHYKKSAIVRGRFKVGTIAVCVYLAGKELGHEMTPSEVISMFEINTQTFNKCFRLIETELNLVTKPSDFTSAIVRRINFDGRFNNVVDKVAGATEFFSEFDSFSPQSVALASVLFADSEMGGKLNLRDLCKLLRCNPGNIIKILRVLRLKKQEIFAAAI